MDAHGKDMETINVLRLSTASENFVEKLHQKDKVAKYHVTGRKNETVRRIRKVHVVTETWHKHHWESALF